jgi:hypothetical protein
MGSGRRKIALYISRKNSGKHDFPEALSFLWRGKCNIPFPNDSVVSYRVSNQLASALPSAATSTRLWSPEQGSLQVPLDKR